MLFMSLLTVPVVKNRHILAGIYFIFVKEGPRPNSKVLQYQIWTSRPHLDRKRSYQVTQILALFYNLVVLILG